MTDIQLGQPFELTAEGGYGSGVGSVPQGAVVTPFEIVPPGTAGVGFAVEDVVLANYLDTVTFPGTTVDRTLAIALSTFEGAFTLYEAPEELLADQPAIPSTPDPAPTGGA
ncbi:hypothetical protein [Streptomyces sp. RTd22]|uniref:hypothetical protein n=1 Tax=Streptomyces sp. RTd22 TaxID=1841249 RepID=UPI0007C4C6A7|nr:hypothetical protein [Streptomyces sp. RTd22]